MRIGVRGVVRPNCVVVEILPLDDMVVRVRVRRPDGQVHIGAVMSRPSSYPDHFLSFFTLLPPIKVVHLNFPSDVYPAFFIDMLGIISRKTAANWSNDFVPRYRIIIRSTYTQIQTMAHTIILRKMLKLAKIFDVTSAEYKTNQDNNPAESADTQGFHITDNIAGSLRFTGLAAYHKLGTTKT
jgi:hypothetical protein